MSDPIDDALAAVTPRIAQPALRELAPGERVVRTAGLKFILPTSWKAGDVLTEEDALFINSAHHTALINRFGETRRTLLENPDCTYADLDKALQAHYENFKVNPRTTDTSDPETTSEEDRELISFAREPFNKMFGGKGIPRKEYEAMLRDYVKDNRELLTNLMNKQKQTITSLTEDLAGAFGSED